MSLISSSSEEPPGMEPGNIKSNIVYALLSALFLINISLVGTLYTILSTKIANLDITQNNVENRVIALEAGNFYKTKTDEEIINRLARIEQEIVSFKVQLAGRK